MKIGHHGVNYPVKSPFSNKGDITVQNHSFVIDEDSIKGRKDVTVTLRNVNDNSIEEMVSDSLKFISTQYYPASPGFDEVHESFRRFLDIVKK
jgi:carbamoyl-phosphate synthase small subunit